MPDDPNPSNETTPQADIPVEDALRVISERLSPTPKSYEDGLAEGVKRGREEVLGKIGRISGIQKRLQNFGEAHDGTPAGRAFQQIDSDIADVIESITNTPDKP